MFRPRCASAGFLVRDADGIGALLWAGSTELSNDWLLPASADPIEDRKVWSRAGR